MASRRPSSLAHNGTTWEADPATPAVACGDSSVSIESNLRSFAETGALVCAAASSGRRQATSNVMSRTNMFGTVRMKPI